MGELRPKVVSYILIASSTLYSGVSMGKTFEDFVVSSKIREVFPLAMIYTRVATQQCMEKTADSNAYRGCPKRMFVLLSFTATNGKKLLI